MATKPPIVLWHGSRRWSGPPSVHPARKGRTEGGPGIYLTTSYETARKYSKGGGVVMRFYLDPNVVWLEESVIDLQDAIAFVKTQPRLPKKEEIIADLRRNAERIAPRLGGTRIEAAVIVNLMVNHEALYGQHGPALASFLVKHGIDVSLANTRSGEDWVVVFNPNKILSTEQMPSDKFEEQFSLPLVRHLPANR